VLPHGVRSQIGRAGRFFAPPYAFMGLADVTFPSIEGALLCLRNRGFRPRFAIDVGAYHGEWTTLFKELFPQSDVLMVEAQEQKREALQSVCDRYSKSVDFRTALLGASSGDKARFVEMETGSSVYEEQSRYDRHATEKIIVTLDDLLAADSRPVDFIKLDVQGYELEVLRGAARSLGQAQAVLMEASLVPINQGAPLFAEVVRFMDERGFRVVDFCSQIRRRDGVLWQTDLLFIRASSPLVPDPRLTEDNWQ
jgi:FkbM family methyltransferase